MQSDALTFIFAFHQIKNRLNGEPHNWLCLWITAVKVAGTAACCVFFLPLF